MKDTDIREYVKKRIKLHHEVIVTNTQEDLKKYMHLGREVAIKKYLEAQVDKELVDLHRGAVLELEELLEFLEKSKE